MHEETIRFKSPNQFSQNFLLAKFCIICKILQNIRIYKNDYENVMTFRSFLILNYFLNNHCKFHKNTLYLVPYNYVVVNNLKKDGQLLFNHYKFLRTIKIHGFLCQVIISHHSGLSQFDISTSDKKICTYI